MWWLCQTGWAAGVFKKIFDHKSTYDKRMRFHFENWQSGWIVNSTRFDLPTLHYSQMDTWYHLKINSHNEILNNSTSFTKDLSHFSKKWSFLLKPTPIFLGSSLFQFSKHKIFIWKYIFLTKIFSKLTFRSTRKIIHCSLTCIH